MEWWIWMVIGLALLAGEIMVPGGVVMMFFGIAALLVGLLQAVGLADALWLQMLLFSVFSVVSLLTLRGPIVRRMKAAVPEASTMDNLVGDPATALSEMPPGAVGKAELRGSVWRAKNAGGGTLRAGETYFVERVDGLTLMLREGS
ncbi:MAG: NfeD family protein [Acidobacteriota bacterium]